MNWLVHQKYMPTMNTPAIPGQGITESLAGCMRFKAPGGAASTTASHDGTACHARTEIATPPARIKTACRASLATTAPRPPKAMYTPAASAATVMVIQIDTPGRSVLSTMAPAYSEPGASTSMLVSNSIAENASLDPRPKRSSRYCGAV